jgi:hypothetical protein
MTSGMALVASAFIAWQPQSRRFSPVVGVLITAKGSPANETENRGNRVNDDDRRGA